MSKHIAISDEVYRRLKCEKGDRSFSEVIAERLDTGDRLADVAGQRIYDQEATGGGTAVIERLSEGTMDRLDDEFQ